LSELHTRIQIIILEKKIEETHNDFRNFIQEILLKKSKFTIEGGYITPDKEYITVRY
jgi:hypothetical protein